MSDMLLPASIYFVDSILSGLYTWNFLKGKYRKRIVLPAWGAAFFLIQIVLFEILEGRFPFSEVMEIIINICVLLSMQFLFFNKDMPKQLFTAFSFVAGKETVKHIVSVFSTAFTGLWNKIFDFLLSLGMLNTAGSLYLWTGISVAVIAVVCALFYAPLLYAYLLLINRKFVRKDYSLQTHQNVFLILRCIASLCIYVTIKMMILSFGA